MIGFQRVSMIKQSMHNRVDTFLKPTFSMLCWNVHKEMGHTRFDRHLQSLLAQELPDLLLFQEAVLDRHTATLIDGYNFACAINIDLRRKQYGVLSAARCAFVRTLGMKTLRRELRFATRKSVLISTHVFEDGVELTTVNLHAINFVSANIFVEEIDRLIETLSTIQGPMIVTGDFNTWSAKRLRYLESFAQIMCLKSAEIRDQHHIKRRFAKPLDHLYFRGLSLNEARAIDTGDISDHNPIVARFIKGHL